MPVRNMPAMERNGSDDLQVQSYDTRVEDCRWQMGDGTRLAIAILMLFLAMVAFFFAFHPGGVQGASDPDTMLQWLFGEFNTASQDGGASANAKSTTDQPTG